MPVKEILVLRSGGQPLFNFSPEGAPILDTLVAGFLSAQAGFAQEIGEGTIQIVTFAENKFVYEIQSDLIFIIVIHQDEEEHIYRVLLKEIAQSFVQKYQSVLGRSVIPSQIFEGFRENLIKILVKYNLEPRKAPKYPSAILEPEVTQKIENLIRQIEGKHGFLRAALLTTDSHVISTGLYEHELQFTLTQFQRSWKQEPPKFFTISSTILGDDVKLFIHLLPKQMRIAAIVRKEMSEMQLAKSIAPILPLFNNLDLTSMVKLQAQARITKAYSDFEVLTTTPKIRSTLFIEDSESAGEFRELFGKSGIDIIKAIDGVATVVELRDRTGVHGRQLLEILNYLEIKGYIRKVQFFPMLDTTDTRFLAYLETVGIPRDEFKILNQAKHFCDGHNTVRDIAQRIGVEHEKLVGILRKLGDYVEWLT
ncbi:MAG: hypothetical protein ACFFDP_11995 [Promethearchaeota archaeon]